MKHTETGEKKTGDSYQITQWCQRMIREQITEGCFCIDATMGNGNDTAFLCRLVGEKGRVAAFDIQEKAVENTRIRLEKTVPFVNYRLIQDSHSNMDVYFEEESADCVVFNLGYLPGGDHRIATGSNTTIPALKQGCRLLKKGGMMSICIYSGKDSGYEEKDAVLSWLAQLDSRDYLVLKTEYYNRPNDPPIPVLVIKNR